MNKRQKKQIAIALGILVIVAIIFLVMRGGTQSVVDEPRQWDRMANLERIEIAPPAAAEGPELIVLEKRDRQWWLRRPVEGRMDWSVAERFEARFGRRLVADEVRNPSDRLESYDLSEDRGVKVRLFAEGQERPAWEFIVGRETEVVQTGARRTFIKKPGGDEIYRLRTDIGELVRLPVVELRDRQIAAFSDAKIDAISLKHDDGHQVHIEYVDDRWKLSDGPSATTSIDEQRALRLVTTIASLNATGFPSESPEELGLDEPTTVVEVSAEGSRSSLYVRRIDGEEGPRYVLKKSGDDRVYEVEPRTGELLTARLKDMQSRSLIPVGSWGITEMRLAGRPAVHLRRDDADAPWEMLSPEGWRADQEPAQRLAEFVAGLRVQRWADDDEPADHIDALPAWVRRALPAVRIHVDGEETWLYLAQEVEDRQGARFARYSEQERPFVLSRETVERLTSGHEALGVRE